MEIKTIAVLGAGAVGSYIIWGLDKKVKLGVIGEGERAKRLQKGCLINDQMYYPEVWSPTEAHGVDLLIVSLKYGALKDALKSIQTIVDDHTIVMSLMNGVDSEEIIGEAIGKEHLMPSLIKIASRKENGYRFDPETTIATVYKGNIIKNLIMDCQSYTKYRPNETTGGIFVSWRRKEELPTGA
ncbi:2-dehydropantoate 2-reductase [Faecalibacillus sp. MSK20_93]|uniref:ketopantoate reductase family protein n=1 Tax=Faecalibacillus sp. MSK20_93 TaxID=2884903 RepID=UPI001D0BB017|nr:2-dehydropantoate 2-reductase [Faecalibacillus sp. MSK20_93]MCB8549117.1 2-dehydropantoate 2-reductase [Faecalibacillus sp. MSK20_93]